MLGLPAAVSFCFCWSTTVGAVVAAGGGVVACGPVEVVVCPLPAGAGGGEAGVLVVVDGLALPPSWITVVVLVGGGVVPSPTVVVGYARAERAARQLAAEARRR